MTILDVDDDLPYITNMVYMHLKYKSIDIYDIMAKTKLSFKVIHAMRREGKEISLDSRRRFLVSLLEKYEIKILETNGFSRYIIREGLDTSFFKLEYQSLEYDRDTKSLRRLLVSFDIVRKLIDFHENGNFYVDGRYRENNDITSCEVNNSSINYYIRQTSGVTYITMEIIFSGMVPLIEENYLFGIYTKRTGISMSTGRIVVSNRFVNHSDRDQLDKEVICYLTNEKFHEFYKYKTNVSTYCHLRDLYSNFNQKYRLINIELPKELAAAYQQFLSFFAEYVDKIKGKEIKFDVNKSGNGLDINIEVISKEVKMDEINFWLREYINFAKKQSEVIRLNVESDISNAEVDIFIVHLKNQVAHLEGEVNILTLKNSFLEVANVKAESHIDHLQKVVIALSDRNVSNYNVVVSGNGENFANNFETNNMKIENQNIYGGSQQFADKINNFNNLSDNDRKIVEVIEGDNPNIDKDKVVESLATIKSPNVKEEDKVKSKSFLQTVLNATISEGAKMAIRAILTQGSEYVHFQDLIN